MGIEGAMAVLAAFSSRVISPQSSQKPGGGEHLAVLAAFSTCTYFLFLCGGTRCLEFSMCIYRTTIVGGGACGRSGQGVGSSGGNKGEKTEDY